MPPVIRAGRVPGGVPRFLAQRAFHADPAGDFMPPVTGGVGVGTAPDSYTTLLMHADGTAGSTSFTDSSSYAHTLTPSGATVNATAKFGSGSADFTASNTAHIDTGNQTDFLFGNGPFTVEAWCYLTSSPNLSAYNCVIASLWGSNVNQDSWWFGWIDNGAPGLLFSDGGNYGNVTSNYTTPALNTWTHIAVDRDAGSNIRIYVNGVVVGGPVNQAASFGNAPAFNCLIGDEGLSSTINFLGYLDEVRISKGIARYGGAFTPPTAPFGGGGALAQDTQTLAGAGTVSGAAGAITGTLAVTEGDETLAAAGTVGGAGAITGTLGPGPPIASPSCVLLLHADGSAGSTSFTDSSLNAHTLTPTSTTVNATSKFGSGAADFTAGSTSAIDTGNATDFNFGAGPFTVEAWIYPTSLSSFAVIAAQTLTTGSNNGWIFSASSTALSFAYSANGSGSIGINASYTIPLNTWTHAAVDFDGTTLRVYINGAVLGTGSLGGAIYPSTLNTLIGNTPDNVGNFTGYLDEVRVTKGLAMYGGAFTPVSQPFTLGGLTQADQTLSAAGTVGAAGAITGTLNVTEASDSLAAIGTVLVGGTLSSTQASHTLAALGTVQVAATLAATQASHTLAALGSVGFPVLTGSVTATQASHTLAATGLGAAFGPLVASQAPHTLAALGAPRVGATLSSTQASHTLAAAGSVIAGATLNVTQASHTLAATGWSATFGPVAATQTAHTLVALGADALGGTLVVTQASHTLVALGASGISGALGVTQASHTLAAAGGPVLTGTLTAAQASHTLAATGWRAASGALIDTQDAHTLAGSGSVVTGTSGSLILPQAPHSLVAAGTVATSGTLAVSQASHTLAAVGRSTISGTLTATQTSQTLAAVGNGAAMGTLTAPQASHILAATGRATVAGVLAAIQDSQIIAATGRPTVVGALLITQANQTLNGYGLFGATEQARVLVMA